MIRGAAAEIREGKQRRSCHINIQLLTYTLQSEIQKPGRKVLTSRAALRRHKGNERRTCVRKSERKDTMDWYKSTEGQLERGDDLNSDP